MHDEHGRSRVGDDGTGNAAEQVPDDRGRRWEPSTMRLGLRASAVWTIPFQVGAASTAMLSYWNPAFSASEAS
jgi:hypothetical protein